MNRYFANLSGSGAVRNRDVPGAIGVLEALGKPMPIGMASQVGRTEGGSAVWRLTIQGADVPGRWVIIDRQFVAVEGDPGGESVHRVRSAEVGKGGSTRAVDTT